jgi:hypothetical protein
MRMSESFGIVPLLPAADQAAGVDGDSFSMALYESAMILVQLGSITVADFHVKVFAGATNGTKTTALTFWYRLGGAAAKSANADQLSAFASSADLTVSNATGDNKLLVIELEAESLPAGKPWVTLEIGSGATALLAASVAILGGARYRGATVPTAI